VSFSCYSSLSVTYPLAWDHGALVVIVETEEYLIFLSGGIFGYAFGVIAYLVFINKNIKQFYSNVKMRKIYFMFSLQGLS
jgi:hypothetical protein